MLITIILLVIMLEEYVYEYYRYGRERFKKLIWPYTGNVKLYLVRLKTCGVLPYRGILGLD